MKNAVSNKIRLLKNIKPNPDWLQSQRSVLFLQVKESGKQAQWAWSLPGFFAPAFKPVVAFGLVLCLIFGSGFLTVFAAKSSLPGSLFYPVKMVLENARMKISSQETQPKLQAEFVGNRAEELSQIVNQVNQNEDPIVKKERVVRAVDKLKTQVASTKVNLNKANLNVETAGIIGEKAAQSEKALLDAKEKFVSEFNGDESKEVVQAIDAAVKEVKETSTLAAELSQGKAGTEVQMEVKEIEPQLEKFNEASASFEEIKN